MEESLQVVRAVGRLQLDTPGLEGFEEEVGRDIEAFAEEVAQAFGSPRRARRAKPSRVRSTICSWLRCRGRRHSWTPPGLRATQVPLDRWRLMVAPSHRAKPSQLQEAQAGGA